VFDPRLAGVPVLVLSSNDGCAIARSEEVKALGVRMGEPAFRLRGLIARHRVRVFSSNYVLYGDMMVGSVQRWRHTGKRGHPTRLHLITRFCGDLLDVALREPVRTHAWIRSYTLLGRSRAPASSQSHIPNCSSISASRALRADSVRASRSRCRPISPLQQLHAAGQRHR
jgi:hypothetical protein